MSRASLFIGSTAHRLLSVQLASAGACMYGQIVAGFIRRTHLSYVPEHQVKPLREFSCAWSLQFFIVITVFFLCTYLLFLSHLRDILISLGNWTSKAIANARVFLMQLLSSRSIFCRFSTNFSRPYTRTDDIIQISG